MRRADPATSSLAPPFRSSRSWRIDAPTERVWAALADADRYADWWPFLRGLDTGEGFVDGAVWTCAVRPPLPYSVRFRVHLVRIVPGRSVRAAVSGDVTGDATLEVSPEGDSTALALRSELRPSRPLLRGLSLVARPVARWGHDAVLDQGVERMVRLGVDGSSSSPGTS